MNSNLLLNKIHLIQIEYKKLLVSLLPKFKSGYAPEALDEISLFEHLPFLLMGNKHILDDPLSKYSLIRSEMSEGKDADFLYKQISVTAEDNLKVLENIHNEILILPLRLLNQSNDQKVFEKAGEQAFVSLFNGIYSLNEYFEKCNSIDDIIHFARDDIERLVMFSEDDDVMLDFKERFRIALRDTKYMVDPNRPDSYNFFMLVFGFTTSTRYHCIMCGIRMYPIY